MPAVEIKPMGPPIKVSGSVTRSSAPATPTTPAAPAAPAAPVVPPKVSAAPPVPPPVESKPDIRAPFESKSKKDFFNRLKEKSGPAKTATTEPQKPDETTAQTPKPEGEETTATGTDEDEGVEGTDSEAAPKPQAAEAAADPKVKAKVNPWKLVDEWKGKAATLEAQLLETKKLIPDEAGRKTEVERLTKAEQRAKELEEEIRYVNYSKHPEFLEKYDLPYQESFKRAMSELGELTIQDEAGTARPAEPKDLLDIVNLPLGKAKERAMELFGDFADEAMAHRKDVRRLWDERVRALENARKTATEREQHMAQQHKATSEELTKFVTENWEKANEAVRLDPEQAEFFKEVEGDEERNTILKKGYEFVDSALTGNPMDPRLKPEDRTTIIKKHAALRNRAAAYGTLKHLLKQERDAHKATLEKLKQYEASTPTTEGGTSTTTNGTPARASDQVFGKLRALARR